MHQRSVSTASKRYASLAAGPLHDLHRPGVSSAAIHYVFTVDHYPSDMPTVFRLDGYRFFFYALEGNEPPHVHVERGDNLAKFWLQPVELAASNRFRPHELRRVRLIVIAQRQGLLEAWDEFFGRSASTNC